MSNKTTGTTIFFRLAALAFFTFFIIFIIYYDKNFSLMVFIMTGVILSIIIYFIPSLVASSRRAKHRLGILILNFFLGCTVLGWVGALIWAVCDDKEDGRLNDSNKRRD